MRFTVAAAALLLCCSSITLAQQTLPRLDRGDSRLRSLNVINAEPVAGVYANSVEADLVIGTDGSVESVTILKGNQAHRASATRALRQFRFLPVVIAGKPSRFITKSSVYVPDTLTVSAAKGDATASSVSVTARRDVVLRADCGRAVSGITPSADPIRVCREALEATKQYPASAYERREAHSQMGDAYLSAKRWAEAVAEFQAALAIDYSPEFRDYSDAKYLLSIGIAHYYSGNLSQADQSVTTGIATFEKSMAANPEERELYVRSLKIYLGMHARIKQERGLTAEAQALDRRAAGLTPSK